MQQQKMLMYVFPVMFAVMGINFPVGVLVYWLTTNVWTMGQQMYVINQNPTPGSKAQAHYLERLVKSVSQHGEVRGKRRLAVVQAIVAKGPDRNDNERKFITSLSKQGFAAQADGSVLKSDTAAAEAEGAAPKRQQPKRQTKAQRQAAAQQDDAAAKTSLAKDSGDAADEVSEEKKAEPQDAKPQPEAKPKQGKPTAGQARAKSGQRKGQQRPKHPSKK
jgi:YidC/Oxa1 family membrane protein insertase